jgi:hypothetical protein
MEETMKQLVSSAMILAAAVTIFACSSSDNGGGNGSSSGGSSGSGSSSSSGSSGGLPTISITSPAANATVMSTPPDDTVPVGYTTTNFMGVAALSAGCDNASNNCGHVHVLVDGSMCTPTNSPYNNDGFTSPINAILSSCPMAAGMHTVTLELHHNDHSPILDANMMTISTHVAFTAGGGSSDGGSEGSTDASTGGG